MESIFNILVKKSPQMEVLMLPGACENRILHRSTPQESFICPHAVILSNQKCFPALKHAAP